MKYLKAILGILLFPILFGLFMLDRMILVMLPHVKGYTVQESFASLILFKGVFIRTMTIGFIYGIYLLIKWL